MTNYSEYHDSQKPALELLRKLGWKYISPSEALAQRDGLYSSVILENILADALQKINQINYRGKEYSFSSSNIQGAINALKKVDEGGLIATNEKVYDLLTLGKSFEETIKGDKKGHTMKFVDWKNIKNNVFHCTEEFEVEGRKGRCRPDIVLYVNGIPFVVIENKRRDKNLSVDEGISQNLRNQQEEEGIPRLFYYAQMLLSVQPNEVRFATTATPMKFWSIWKEDNEKECHRLIKKSVQGMAGEDRLPTEQDRTLLALCSINRLMDISYKYIVFDGHKKKICRYQQYFAVQKTIARVKQRDKNDNRRGGVIWHTTGSGKSLTMVMISKALALDNEIVDPRILVVTDRKSLDKQIFNTFVKCGKVARKASSGSHLVELLKDKGNEIITAIIDKFKIATSSIRFKDESKNIFVLVDESHRSNYGSAHASMRKMLPNAVFIGFTGTPLMKSEKSTSQKFGGFIHKYTIDQAVKDKAVLELLYEGRSAKLTINKKQIDKGFERLSTPLSGDGKKDLKKKFSSISKIYESDSVVEEIAYDISQHYTTSWQGTIAKAQLAVTKIDVAIKFQKYFESQTDPSLRINTKVIFTPPDSRKDNEDVWSESSNESRKYWDSLMKEYTNQERYEKYVIERFKESDNEIEMIIVVSKLLTGFDAPINTLLYLAKPMHGHNLLQAIARVNRLFDGKDYGYIIDYVGVLGKLDAALTEYSAFEEFDEEDLVGAVKDMTEVIRKLPTDHANVADVFNQVKNKNDIEELERSLFQKDVRDQFYEALTTFARTLQVCLSSDTFYEEYTAQQVGFYKAELKRFMALRTSVAYRYAEKISYKEYEPRVKKLLNTYVDAEEIYGVTKDVNIFDNSMVAEALESYGASPSSKADFIAHRVKKAITERLEKDEAFYKKFSDMIEDTIEAFNEGRLSEQDYLEKVNDIRDNLVSGYQEGIPDKVMSMPEARAIFGSITEVLTQTHGKDIIGSIAEDIAQAGLDITTIIENLTIRDWKKNLDIQHKMENAIEDYLMDHRKDLGVEINFDDIDAILARCLKVAKNNY